ncbi:hypothetical protein ACS0TY_011521 [Phlomoides rotata]
MAFLIAEMGTSRSLDGHQRLMVKGWLAPKTFEGILNHYFIFCSLGVYIGPRFSSAQ